MHATRRRLARPRALRGQPMNWVAQQLVALGQKLEPVVVDGEPIELRGIRGSPGPFSATACSLRFPICTWETAQRRTSGAPPHLATGHGATGSLRFCKRWSPSKRGAPGAGKNHERRSAGRLLRRVARICRIQMKLGAPMRQSKLLTPQPFLCYRPARHALLHRQSRRHPGQISAQLGIFREFASGLLVAFLQRKGLRISRAPNR